MMIRMEMDMLFCSNREFWCGSWSSLLGIVSLGLLFLRSSRSPLLDLLPFFGRDLLPFYSFLFSVMFVGAADFCFRFSCLYQVIKTVQKNKLTLSKALRRKKKRTLPKAKELKERREQNKCFFLLYDLRGIISQEKVTKQYETVKNQTSHSLTNIALFIVLKVNL